jgi:hypothetical protein
MQRMNSKAALPGALYSERRGRRAMTTTTEMKLRAAAEAVLQSHNGDIRQAAPAFARELIEDTNRPLLVALTAVYLTSVAAEPVVAEATFVPPPVEPKAAPSAAAAPPAARRRKRRRSGTPTAGARAGAIAAMQLEATTIFELRIRGIGKLGDIHVHQLRALAKNKAIGAADEVRRGLNSGVHSIAFGIMADHCVAVHSYTKVREAIPAHVMVAAYEQAKIRAAEILRDGAAKIASDLIASARMPAQIEAARQ